MSGDINLRMTSRFRLIASRETRAAGIRSMFVTCCAENIPENAKLATASCTDYRRLPTSFWEQLVAGTLVLEGSSFT
ncbi:MAG TPA: hypothetical protein VKG05_01990 [Steroidobacteraceae bacterium]|nr:hypothetical protein [Steroidobacteraceae bacterium]